jgi:hypothetical protein
MTTPLRYIFLVILLLLSSHATPQTAITEEYAVQILDGNKRASTAMKPPGFTFIVPFALSNHADQNTSQRSARGTIGAHENFFKKLIPLGRALESETLVDFRFTLTVHPASPPSEDQNDQGAQYVAERIRHFLVTYFAIHPGRLTINFGTGASQTPMQREEPVGPQKWRVEVARDE